MGNWRTAPESGADYSVLRATDVMVPMRDGVRMATDIYFPSAPENPAEKIGGRLPSVLIRTPYNKVGSADTGEYFARRGYVVVIQDCRGRYRSEGIFYFLTQESEDGFDAVEWVGTQPWSDGQVGMMGTSYLGWTQTAAAVLNPPHLSTLVVNQAGASAYSSSVRHNGTMELRFLAWAFMGAATGTEAIANPAVRAALEDVQASDWLDALPWAEGQTPLAAAPSSERWALDLYRNGDYGEYWEHPGFNFQKLWNEHADVPTLFSGAWYDSYTRATIENYVGLSERLTSPVRLMMGPWTHGTTTVDQTFSGDIEYGPTASIAGNLAHRLRPSAPALVRSLAEESSTTASEKKRRYASSSWAASPNTERPKDGSIAVESGVMPASSRSGRPPRRPTIFTRVAASVRARPASLPPEHPSATIRTTRFPPSAATCRRFPTSTRYPSR